MKERFQPSDNNPNSRIARAADIYHEKVYTRVSSVVGRVTDKTDVPLTEAVFPAAVACDLVAREDSLPASVRGAAYALGYGLILTGSLYFPNMVRTPLSEKLGLQEREFSVEEEMDYVVDQLNQRANSPRLDFDELVPLAHNAITGYLNEKDGYRTEGTKKVKNARVLKNTLNKLGVRGLMNPLFGEIITTSDRFNDLLAHEFAHSKGVAHEAQAQIAGVLSQIESGNPSLEYVGYENWLWMLIKESGFSSRIPHENNPIPTLQKIGLNSQTLEEVQEQIEYLQTHKYGSTFGKYVNDVKLKALGQKDTKYAYLTKPLAYLADYRAKSAK